MPSVRYRRRPAAPDVPETPDPGARVLRTLRPGAWSLGTLVSAALVLAVLAPTSAQAWQADEEGSQDAAAPPAAAAWDSRYELPPASVQELFRRDKNYTVLDQLSPDGRTFLVPHVRELSSLERMGRPTYRLAGLELRPATDRTWRLDTFGIDGLTLRDIDGAERTIDLPAGGLVSDMTWSPDGARLAFLWHGPERSELWVADTATGSASRLADAAVMATLATRVQNRAPRASRMVQWTPRDTVVTLLVPPGRGPEPERGVAVGPIVRRTREQPTPGPTQPFLLRDAVDAARFRHYTTSQIAELGGESGVRLLGEPGMFERIALAPAGDAILTERIVEPLSPITSAGGFGRTLEVRDGDGAIVATVRERGLREGRGGDADRELPRDVVWAPDGSLMWLQRPTRPESPDDPAGSPADVAADDEPADDDTPSDRVMRLAAPFDGDAVELLASDDALNGLVLAPVGDRLFAQAAREGKNVLVTWSLDDPAVGPTDLTAAYDAADPLALPGSLMTVGDGNGIERARISADGGAVFLQGSGYRDDLRPRPFIDRVPLSGGDATRIFEGAEDEFQQPLVPLDDDLTRLVVQRESVSRFPDSWLWTLDEGFFRRLTTNADPFPEITGAERIDFTFERRDGLEIRARISMPVGWREGDDPVPAIFWTYPREYRSERDYERAAIRARNLNAFTHLSYLRWSDIWLSQGYALVYPDVPIIGDPYNDRFIQHLVDSLYGAIREVDRLGLVDVDRIGHGGHSYGAFATGNLLANTPFFKAGIAGDGAYNRTLTPMGFQGERRFVWEARDTYLEMSPFFRADHIDTPLLMYHGADDNNTGTWPMQSRRMIQALTGLGKTAVLYEYPYESHGPSAVESYLDLWKRWLDWFDRYVKNPTADVDDEPNGS